MAVYFFDTSAPAKRYTGEKGFESVDKIFSESGSHHLISKLTAVEIQSAFATKVRTNEISSEECDAYRGGFLADVTTRKILVLSLENIHYQDAENLIVQYGKERQIRTLDALQLSLALSVEKRHVLDFFVCSDQKLCAIAEKAGLSVINPENP